MRDINLELAGLLYDMAAIAGDSQRAWGYKRAAKAVLRIDRDITPLVTANTFKAISGIGPTTDRIARELLHDGGSAFVEKAIAELGKEDDVARLRGFRHQFLSRAAVRQILSRKGAPSPEKYRGDFQMHSIWSDGAETLESIGAASLEGVLVVGYPRTDVAEAFEPSGEGRGADDYTSVATFYERSAGIDVRKKPPQPA